MTLKSSKVMRDRVLGDILLFEILNESPIFKDGEFLPDIEFELDDLDKFANFSIQMRVLVETQLGLTIRSDIKKKATEQLGDFLKTVGLKLKMNRSKKVNGKKIYLYKLDLDAYSLVEGIASTRRKIAAPGSVSVEWTFVNDLHGFDGATGSVYPEILKIRGSRRDNGPIFDDFI